jgi:S-DNA-T family DNA segregation ATPase FtsK/SpoIIIE
MIDQQTPTDTFNRPPRIARTWRVETVELPEPPVPSARHQRSNWIALGMPLLSAAALVGAMVAINSGGNGLLFGIPMAVMAVTGVIATLLTNRSSAKQAAADFARQQAFFELRLGEQQLLLQQLYDEEQRLRREALPDPEAVLRLAGALGTGMPPQERLWERRPEDPDFLEFRAGLGGLPFSTTIIVRSPQRDSPVDPRLYELERTYRTLVDVPIAIPLGEAGSLAVIAQPDAGHALLRWLVWQAAVFHAPTDLRIAAVYPPDAAREWDWIAWLPHTVPPNNDDDYQARMHASSGESAERVLTLMLDQLHRRRDVQAQQHNTNGGPPPAWMPMLLIVEGLEYVRNQSLLQEILRDGPQFNLFTLLLVERQQDVPGECGAMLDLLADSPRWARAGQQWSQEPFAIEAEQATVRLSDRLARRLAAIELADAEGQADVPRSVRLFDLLGIADEADLTPPPFWRTPPQRAWHSDVPIGAKAGGQPLYLDLYEQMHGPHGIIAGATGAGKSVLLQGIIAALTIKHSPKQLQLLLIDFKGGASLAQLSQLPHAVGFVTDLEGRMAERAMTAIKSELRYRKLLFRTAESKVASKVENISEYREKVTADLPPLPNLLIIIDEFDEMVQSYREFVAELVRVVKQGRSLGVHLLVASQQPAKAVTDDIRTQLKFFVALRLGSSEDSREMLGNADAAFLPTDVPGRAYFRVGADVTLFQSALVVGPYRSTKAAQSEEDDIIFHGPGNVRAPAPPKAPAKDAQKTTDMDVLVRALRQAGADLFKQEREQSGWEPRPIWQPPLPARLSLGELRPHDARQLQQEPERLWQPPPQRDAWLQPAIGRLDIPQESRQEPLRIDLADGHLAVIGASGSGKTMLLRTLLIELALTHAPQDVWCYVIDAGGQGLSLLSGLPQIGGLIQAREREHVRRLLTMIDREIRRRQALFRDRGASDLRAYRQYERLPAWVVVIDKLALLREEFRDKHGYETITEDLIRLARVARAYGVHFVITADSTRDFGHQLLALFDTRIALRLPELQDYSDVLGSRVTSQIPTTVPGRGLWVHPELGALDVQIALPLLERPDPAAAEGDEQASVLESELNAELKTTVEAVRAAAERAPNTTPPLPIELLPEQLTQQQLGAYHFQPRQLAAEIWVPLGKQSVDLEVAHLRLSQETPHALLLGGRRSGKTTALQSVLMALACCYTEEQIRLLIVAPRRSLRALSSLPHTERYATTEAEIQEVVELLQKIVERPEAGQQRWIGAIDDYDIGYKQIESQFRSPYDGTNLFSTLKRLAAESGGQGIHLVIAANVKYPEEAGDVVKTLEAARNGLILWPHKYDGGTRLLDVALPVGDRDSDLPPGRALLVREDSSVLVQVATVPQAEIEQVVASIK